MKYVCKICAYVYDEKCEGVEWKDLPENWLCPVCGAGKSLFEKQGSEESEVDIASAVSDAEQTAADVIVSNLVASGVRCAFGMVGHSILGVADALRKFSEQGKMRFVSIRHEGAAAFACSAYGKLMAKPAMAVTIAGPGATNLMTGLYDAKLDSAPVLALTGQVDSKTLGRYIFQEIDLLSAFKDVCVFQAQIAANSDFSALADRAFKTAQLRGGVSQLVLPDDVQTHIVKTQNSSACEVQGSLQSPLDSDMENLAKFLNASKRPFILAGAGARDSAYLIKKLAEKLKCPVATTYRAKGLIEDSFKYSCAVAGLSGTAVAAKMLDESDCILAFGCGLSKHTSLPMGKTLVQIDCDASAFGRRRNPDCAVLGDCALVLDKLLELTLKDFEDRSEDIARAWQDWRKLKQELAGGEVFNSAAALEVLSEKIESDAIVSVDVGEVAYSLGKYFEAKSQTFLLSFYLGSIGVGLPSAIGAWCAANEEGSRHFNRKVYAYVGDGGFGQYLAEWTTVAKYNMDIVCIVENNSELAKISKEQRNAKMQVWETSLKNPNFAEYARSCGTKAVRVCNKKQLREALDNIPSGEPYLIELITSK